MSAPTTTPSPMAKTADPTDPTTVDDTVQNPVKLFRFEPDILKLVVDIIAPGSVYRDILRKGLDTLLSDHWQATTWGDLKVFTALDVAMA